MSKVISAKEAAALVKDNMTLALSGFLGFGVPEDILGRLEERYLSDHSPRDLTVFYSAGISGDGKTRGVNHLGHEGLIKKLYCSNNSIAPNMSNLMANNVFPAFMAPQGVVTKLFRAIAAGQPGVITHVGLKTFVDPRVEGGAVNDKAKATGEKVAELMTIKGKEYLFYPSLPVHIAFIKGTTADDFGNITLEKEAAKIEQFEIAAAAKNSGGIVVAQVDRLAKRGSLKARDVVVPGSLVDYIVIGDPDSSRQHYTVYEDGKYIPSWADEIKIPLDKLPPIPLDAKKVCARRASMELVRNGFINLGIGVPTFISNIASEEGFSDAIVLNIESGVIGGVPASGLATGATYNPEVMIKHSEMFDLYDGGAIDVAYLGAAQIDENGNVNVSKYNGKVSGPGGFINITQNAKKVCFCGTFTAGKLKTQIENGEITIVSEGIERKFVKEVEQITFSGEYARENKKEIYYITERAVFKLEQEGLTLIEIAPGVDLEKDILGQMDFKPLIAKDLKLMDSRLFKDELMNLVIE